MHPVHCGRRALCAPQVEALELSVEGVGSLMWPGATDVSAVAADFAAAQSDEAGQPPSAPLDGAGDMIGLYFRLFWVLLGAGDTTYQFTLYQFLLYLFWLYQFPEDVL